MEERHFSTLVSLLGEDVLSDDCLVVVTGGNDDKNQNQNQQFEKGDKPRYARNDIVLRTQDYKGAVIGSQ